MPPPSRIIYPAKPRAPKRFPRKILFTVLAGLAVAVLGGGAWYMANLPYLAVDRIEVTGAAVFSPLEIEGIVREALSGVTWAVLPRRNFFIVSGEAIEHQLRRQLPQIEAVDVGKRFPDRLLVRISERKLWGVYCVRVPGEPPGSCAYLDTHGVAYEELSRFAGWLLPVIYGAAPARLGDPAVPAGTLEFFNGAAAALASLGGELLSLSRSTTTPDDVRLSLAEGWSVWLTASRPIPEWLDILRTVLEKEIGGRRSELDYVDLRFGAKVFYKFR